MPDDSTASTESSATADQGRIFERPRELLGEAGFAALRAARVVVVGLGGVGSHAVSALVRAGVGRLLLVDFDVLTWSSMGRVAMAQPEDVGQPKAAVLARRARAFVPEIEIEASTLFFHEDSAAELLDAGPVDLLIDAIDSVNPKVALLREGHRRGLTTLSSMGAAGRTDPAAVRIDDISETRRCPLARVIRRRLRRFGVERGVRCVYSLEEPVKPLPPDEAEPAYARGRARNRLPNLAVMPGIFGYALASEAITSLAGYRLTSET
jgi:tRNA A37 threonylcarbamoyladenosine dehydratase